MKIVLWGVNHRTAPVEVRERLAIAPDQIEEVTRQFLNTPGTRECMVVSTCNRVEFLAVREDEAALSSEVLRFLESHFSVGPNQIAPHLYEYLDQDAVRHLFRVASSLDSMVVGEPQILGQVKDSLASARAAGAVRGTLDRLLRAALVAAKKVRTDTLIGSSSVSIASAAVDLAKRIYGSLEGKQVLLIGAGKMSELAARHLLQSGTAPILVANRPYERAVTVAQKYHGRAIRFEDLHAQSDRADIIITSTGSAQPIFRREHVQAMLHKRRNRPIFLVDIAVPRDVDPVVNRLDGVFLYDIDDLQSVAATNMATRGKEAEKAERIVLEEVNRYQAGQRTLNVVPAIVGIQKNLENTRLTELHKIQTRLHNMPREQRDAVEGMSRSLMNKYLHQAVQTMKVAAREGDVSTVRAVCEMFDVDLPEVAEHDPDHDARAAAVRAQVEAGRAEATLASVASRHDGERD